MSRIIGLDHGAKRIGVAVGDTETRMAFAREAILRSSLARDVEKVSELSAAEAADLVVIGLPLRMDGSEGDQADLARSFGDALASAGMQIAYADERLTTWEADRQLQASGRRPTRRSGELDSTAARLILQQYLDAQAAAPSHDVHPAEEAE
jgi:putative Holliday junction resolvase